MKLNHLLIPALVCLLTLSNQKNLNAQTKKGTWLAEGNLGNLYFSNELNRPQPANGSAGTKYKRYYFSLFPGIGYFVNENLVIGSSINFTFQRTDYKTFGVNGAELNWGTNTAFSASLGPFIRHYFTKNVKGRFYWQLGAGMGLSAVNAKTNYLNDKGEVTQVFENEGNNQIIFGEALIGYNYFFTESIAFHTSLGFNYGLQNGTATYKFSGVPPNGPQKSESFGTNGTIIWGFGFSFILGGKKKAE